MKGIEMKQRAQHACGQSYTFPKDLQTRSCRSIFI